MDRYVEIARSGEFKELRRAKMRFIWPTVILFFIYYLTLPIMSGYAKQLMGTFVSGYVTFGYLFGLTFYIIAWILAFVYVRKARQFDEKAESIIEHYVHKEG